MNAETLGLLIALQPKFREAMGPWEPADWFLYNGNPCFVNNQTDRRLLNDSTIRLPLPIDPFHPERGLIGMLKGPPIQLNGINSIETDVNWLCSVYIGERLYMMLADTPCLALLKALAAQEEIVV